MSAHQWIRTGKIHTIEIGKSMQNGKHFHAVDFHPFPVKQSVNKHAKKNPYCLFLQFLAENARSGRFVSS